MLGNSSGFAALLRKEILNLKFTHCFLRRYALAAKTLPPDLRKILEIIVKVVNMFRGRALNHRLFQSFCEKVGKEHTVLLSDIEIIWLSRSRLQSRLFELRDEIQQFLHKAGHELAGYFDESELIQALVYLADVFTALNELNRFLQGRGISILVACKKLSTFIEKLLLWIKPIKKESLVNFLSLQEILKKGAFLHPNFAQKLLNICN